MNEWLFTAVVIAFISPTETKFVDSVAAMVKSEEACKEATAILKKHYADAFVLVTCDEIKPPPAIIERKRGNKT